MKWTSLCLGTACALSVWVCGSEHFQQRYELVPVTQVQMDAFGTVDVEQADYNRLLVTAEEDLAEYIQLDIQHNKLTVTDTRTDSVWFQTRRLWQQMTGDTEPMAHVHYAFYLQNPESIQLNGFFDARLNAIKGRALSVKYNGMGDLTGRGLTLDQLQLELNGKVSTQLKHSSVGAIAVQFNGLGHLQSKALVSDSLQANLHGNISCQLNGHTQQLNWKMQGAGDCEASGFASRSARIDLQGASDMVVKVEQSLEASTQQGASLQYYGSPKVTAKGANIKRLTGGYQARTYY